MLNAIIAAVFRDKSRYVTHNVMGYNTTPSTESASNWAFSHCEFWLREKKTAFTSVCISSFIIMYAHKKPKIIKIILYGECLSDRELLLEMCKKMRKAIMSEA